MKLKNLLPLIVLFAMLIGCNNSNKKEGSISSGRILEKVDSIKTESVLFESEGINLAGTLYLPENPDAGLVIVHGSDQVPRMTKFAKLLSKNNFAVITYDKRGVGESGGVYAGPEVGTNNIDTTNLNLLAKDADAALKLLKQHSNNIPIGLIGASQAGWIIPIAAKRNQNVDFMVLFSSPLITTLEQLRFQFFTNGRNDFWDKHTEKEARDHTFHDPDKYQFIETDPKKALKELSIPALWLFGKKDIQIPVQLCVEYLDEFKIGGKPFEYIVFPSLGHNTTSENIMEPVDYSIKWINNKIINSEEIEITK